MLTKVEVISARGELLALPLDDASSGYLVKEIEGLDPVQANVVSSEFAQLDISQHQASRREKRNILIRLGLEDGYGTASVRDLRNRLYGIFRTKTDVVLRFFIDGTHFVSITGHVEFCRSEIFTADPEATISLLCFDPDFVAPTSISQVGFTVTGDTEIGISYPGTEPAGFVFEMTLNRPLNEFTIYNRPEGGDFFSMPFAALLNVADTLRISTVAGSKYARFVRAGVERSILYGVSPSATWLQLHPGLNSFRVLASGAPIEYSLTYTPKYGGI